MLLQDYRDLTGTYDKLVSIEMIEAVGWQYFALLPLLFGAAAPDGAMLLQAITIDDRAYESREAGRSFINTYIFPGGCLPSMEIISRRPRKGHGPTVRFISRTSRPTTRRRSPTGVSASGAAGDHSASSATTSASGASGSSTLSYCEGGFRERRIQDVQLLLQYAEPAAGRRLSEARANRAEPGSRTTRAGRGWRTGSRVGSVLKRDAVRRPARRLPRQLPHIPRS